MIKEYKIHSLPEFNPNWEQIPGVNAPAIDYTLLKNKPSTGGSYASFYFNGTAGATGDGTYREVNIGGSNGDLQKAYTGFTLITGLGTMDYTLTRVVNGITISGNSFTVPIGKTCRIQVFPFNSTHSIRVITTGGSRQNLQGGSLDFTTTNQTITFINSGTTDMTFTLNYATSSSARPNFGFSMEIF